MPKHNNLKALMVKFGIKNPDLAKKLNISPSTLSRKINGEYDFTMTEIEIIKDIFKQTYEEIFFNTEILKMSTESSA
ncbi:MAG: hypothetical protein K0R80_2893 [Clostridia bacterium]|nr:hypothetical protein [Clostridia bacterium]